MRKSAYHLYLNIIIPLLAMIVFCVMLKHHAGQLLPAKHVQYVLLLPILVLFVLIHCIKAMRLYLILLEHQIPLQRFIGLYVKTTFVNITIPFKAGELFRVYCISDEVHNTQVGWLSVIIDRFFDTSVLLVFLVPYEAFTNAPSRYSRSLLWWSLPVAAALCDTSFDIPLFKSFCH